MIIATRNSSDKAMATNLTSNCLMLVRTPPMLKKSGVNKDTAMNYLAFFFRIVYLCVEKQSAVKPRYAIGGNEMNLHSLESVE